MHSTIPQVQIILPNNLFLWKLLNVLVSQQLKFTISGLRRPETVSRHVQEKPSNMWMKPINLIFSHVMECKSISWNIQRFKYTSKITTGIFLSPGVPPKKKSIFTPNRLKIKHFSFLASIQQMSKWWFWTKCIISLNTSNLPKHDLFTCFKRSVIQALFNTFSPFPPFLPTKATSFSKVYLDFFLRIIPYSNQSFYVVDNSIHTKKGEIQDIKKDGFFKIINEDCKFRGWGTEFFYGTAAEFNGNSHFTGLFYLLTKESFMIFNKY